MPGRTLPFSGEREIINIFSEKREANPDPNLVQPITQMVKASSKIQMLKKSYRPTHRSHHHEEIMCEVLQKKTQTLFPCATAISFSFFPCYPFYIANFQIFLFD